MQVAYLCCSRQQEQVVLLFQQPKKIPNTAVIVTDSLQSKLSMHLEACQRLMRHVLQDVVQGHGRCHLSELVDVNVDQQVCRAILFLDGLQQQAGSSVRLEFVKGGPRQESAVPSGMENCTHSLQQWALLPRVCVGSVCRW